MNCARIFRSLAWLMLAVPAFSACNLPLDLQGVDRGEPGFVEQASHVAGPAEPGRTPQASELPPDLGPMALAPAHPKSPCSPAELTAPMPIQPPNLAVDTGIGTAFAWNYLACDVWGWHFQLCASVNCSAPEFEAYLSPFPNIRLGWALEPGSTHFWRVRAYLSEAPAGTAGPWSGVRSFSVAESCTNAGQLSAPVLMNPQNGSTQNATESTAGLRPMLRWEASEGCQADDFLVELFMDPESGPVLISHRLGGPVDFWRIDQDLLVGATYFWRVASMLGEEVGPFPAPWTFVTVDAAQGEPAMVTGRVWRDVCVTPPGWDWGDPIPSGCEYREGGLSANGEMEPGEAGIAGAIVSYASGECPAGGAQADGILTDGSGDYSITLTPGTYCLWLDASAGDNPAVLGGGRPTYPACFYDSMDACTLDLTDGEVLSSFDFGWERPSQAGALGSIAGTVWRDSDQDGVRQPGEPGLANVEVRLTCVGCVGGEGAAVTTTGGDGAYIFDSLASATYAVEVARSFPANTGILTTGGWTRPPVPGTSASIQIVLAGGEDRGGVDFGWGFLSFVRPTLYLRATLQLFLVQPTLSIYRSPTPTHTPRFFLMPSSTPRPLSLSSPTPTKVLIPLPPPG